MKIFGRIINPLIAFIGIQLVWIVLVFLWIHWFMGSHRRLRALAEKYSPELLQGGMDWFILVEGLLLLTAILVGVYVIFLYWRRQATLYRAQRQFIAQVTHELKSPLASLKLHLETIRRRRPDPGRMETFLDTMLADSERLELLINNLLEAQRLEQRGLRLSLRPCDLSALTQRYFRSRQFSLPRAGRMELDLEPDIYVKADPEALETVYRNLLENGVIYSNGPPVFRVELRRRGKRAHLSFSDQGRGIDPAERGKVFGMFYRGGKRGETVPGSGLGLFIVKALVRLHRGRVWLESPGPGQGTTVHLQLPLTEPSAGEENP